MSKIAKEIVRFSREYFRENYISLHRPIFNGNEKKYLTECIDSNFVSSVGNSVNKFEEKFAEFTKSKYAISTINGTAALHLSLFALKVSSADEVITQALTFVATSNAIRYLGANPIFIDVDVDTMGLSYKSLKYFLENNVDVIDDQAINKKTKKVIKACLPMHTFGYPCKIDQIIKLCKKFRIPIIEDAAEGLGSYYKNKHLGTFGCLGTFSFNGNKIITTGGGGMIVTDDEILAKRLRHLSTTAKVNHKYNFYHDEIGFNYRLPSINAAMGIAQLESLKSFLVSKEQLNKKWKLLFVNLDVKMLEPIKHSNPNYWLNTIIVESLKQRDEILEYTNNNKVMTRPIWDLMTSLPEFKKCEHDGLKNSKWLVDRCINIPSSVVS